MIACTAEEKLLAVKSLNQPIEGPLENQLSSYSGKVGAADVFL